MCALGGWGSLPESKGIWKFAWTYSHADHLALPYRHLILLVHEGSHCPPRQPQ